MKKKILALVLVVVLALTAITGTLAYFTDTEKAVNTFTVGSVDVKLWESQHYSNDTGWTWEKVTGDDYGKYLTENGTNIVPGREVMKAAYIENTGKNDAYVRMRIRMEKAEFHDAIMVMYNSTALKEGVFTMVKTYFNANGIVVGGADFDENGETEWAYAEYEFIFKDKLAPGAHTNDSPIWKFWLNPAYDNEDITKWSQANDPLDKITVYVDAIQAEGFASAEAAFGAFENQEGTPDNVDGAPDSSDTKQYDGTYGALVPATTEGN